MARLHSFLAAIAVSSGALCAGSVCFVLLEARLRLFGLAVSAAAMIAWTAAAALAVIAGLWVVRSHRQAALLAISCVLFAYLGLVLYPLFATARTG